ncbi:hypothetical protein H4Q26_009879 [Puccinia striiformis f. sp. tritici PST-130]|nr:hypothetical protein H4Q26_009879 [Puccinia striiformis f. sp. tritici PST-130]
MSPFPFPGTPPAQRPKFIIESFLDIFTTHHDPHYHSSTTDNRDGHPSTEWYAARQKRLNPDSTPTKRTMESSPSSGNLREQLITLNLLRRLVMRSWQREEPEWYIKKFMDRTADHRVVAALAVALRTYEITWLQEFIHLKGQIVLTNSLDKINAPGSFEKNLI